MADNQVDMLRSLFLLQANLNNQVFATNRVSVGDGQPLTMAEIVQAVSDDRLGVNDLPNQWLFRDAQAIEAELGELKSDLRWKWWSKDRIDIQNLRVELIDILHFLVSAMIAAGLTPERAHELYAQKHAVNIKR